MQLVTKALLNFCLDENGDDVTSPSRPKKFKMLDMIPEDSPVAEKEEEKEEEEEERNLSSSMGKNNLNVTILAYVLFKCAKYIYHTDLTVLLTS